MYHMNKTAKCSAVTAVISQTARCTHARSNKKVYS